MRFRFPREALHALLLLVGMLTAGGCASTGSDRGEGAPADSPDTAEAPQPAAAVEPAEEDALDGPPQEGAASSVEVMAAASGAELRVAAADLAQPGVLEADVLVFPAVLPDRTAAQKTMVAHFIDVGQGDATLLEFSCGAILIDTGGESTDEVSGRERLREYLDLFFVKRPELAWTLDLVVLSHPHKDHTDGVAGLLDEDRQPITIRNVLDNGATSTGSGISGQKALQKFAQDSGAGYVGLAETMITSVAGVTNSVIDPIDCSSNGGVDPKITALWGRVDVDSAWANNGNNDSVVLRIAFGSARFLFTGDLEKDGIEQMLRSYEADPSGLDADVLKVGHHGSHNATTEAFLTVVTPKVAVIQSGDSTLSRETFSAFSFAHPHQTAVGLLAARVSRARTPVTVRVGVKGRNPQTGARPRFVNRVVDKAIYANGWDGNIAVVAKSNGSLEILSGF